MHAFICLFDFKLKSLSVKSLHQIHTTVQHASAQPELNGYIEKALKPVLDLQAVYLQFMLSASACVFCGSRGDVQKNKNLPEVMPLDLG